MVATGKLRFSAQPNTVGGYLPSSSASIERYGKGGEAMATYEGVVQLLTLLVVFADLLISILGKRK